MRVLVCIATYGVKNLKYLDQVINEYNSFKKYNVDIVINGTEKIYRKNVLFIEHQNPKNTVFFHRKDIIDRKEDYDLYIFSEDDILISEDAIDTYLKYDKNLPIDYCLGFLRFEKVSENNRYLIDLWLNVQNYNYIKNNKIIINSIEYFQVTNPHQSSWILTRDKLNYVINNTEFIINNTDNLGLETGATGLFKNWPFGPPGIIDKVYPLNISDLKNCFIEHLPGNHCNDPGINPETPPLKFRSNTVEEKRLLADLSI